VDQTCREFRAFEHDVRDELYNVFYPRGIANEELISELSSARNSSRALDIKKIKYKSMNGSAIKSPFKQQNRN